MKKITIFILLSISILFAAQSNEDYKKYKKTLLLDKKSRVLKIDKIKPNSAYIFAYPYKGTPTILIKNITLNEHNQTEENIVAYLAINPNTLEYTNNDVSVLSAYKDNFFGDNIFRFCDDKSTFDINTGINVLDKNGSHLQMTKVILNITKNGKIYALGLNKKETIEKFLKEKKKVLAKRFRSIWNAKKSYKKTKILSIDDFTLVGVECNDKKVPILKIDTNNDDNNESVVDLNTTIEHESLFYW